METQEPRLTREAIHEALVAMDESAFIGWSRRGNEPLLAVYSYEKMLDVCVERDGMEFEEAVEYVDFNCVGAWMGERTPIIVMPFMD